MNDNDIIKVYEGLTVSERLNLYRNRYYNDGYATERGIIANAINDILQKYDRQKAEIERLKKNGSLTYKITFDEEKLEEIKNDCLECIDYNIKEIRAEAIKEFAERLKRRHLRLRPCFGVVRCCLSETDIDYLVEEMTEGQHETEK